MTQGRAVLSSETFHHGPVLNNELCLHACLCQPGRTKSFLSSVCRSQECPPLSLPTLTFLPHRLPTYTDHTHTHTHTHTGLDQHGFILRDKPDDVTVVKLQKVSCNSCGLLSLSIKNMKTSSPEATTRNFNSILEAPVDKSESVSTAVTTKCNAKNIII